MDKKIKMTKPNRYDKKKYKLTNSIHLFFFPKKHE